MNRVSLALVVLLTLVALVRPPLARAAEISAAQWAEVEKRFKAADKDNDGSLTLEEAKIGMPRVAKNFDTIDKDHKGKVTLDDIRAAMQGK